MFLYEYCRHTVKEKKEYETLDEAFRQAWLDFEYGSTFFEKIVDMKSEKEYSREDLFKWAEENGYDDDD